jgi:hypothetical protein
MALINHRAREIHFKIVYYGPGLGGKTTNLKILHERLPPERRGRLLSIATDHERTLFFDFLPVDLGLVNGFNTRFHIYTVPGQVYYRLSRRAVLQGLDGLVFVADSHPAREAANRESLDDLNAHLETLELTPQQRVRLPRVFQYNKRDLPVALPIARMRAALNPDGAPEFEAVACEGKGVAETLRVACKAVLARLVGDPAGAPTPKPAAAAPRGRTTGPPPRPAEPAASGTRAPTPKPPAPAAPETRANAPKPGGPIAPRAREGRASAPPREQSQRP